MSEPSEAEFDLNSLNDEELTEQVHDDLYNGLKPEVEQATHIFLKRGWSAEKVLNDALVEGMRIVGIDFRDGHPVRAEVLLAANSMKGGMEILRPLLAETGVEPIGKIVIGTVKGDIHDIGKNLVSMMLEGAGFEVIDLGINNPVEKYLAALEQHKPDILGMSALLTTTMPYMKVVIDTLKERGIRNDFIVLVGGAPLNEEFGKAVGADAYCATPRWPWKPPRGCWPRSAPQRFTEPHVSAVPTRGQGMLIIACGALAHEITALRRANGWEHVDVRCLPAELHNRARAHSRGRARVDSILTMSLPLDLRCLRGLRNGRPSRCGAERGGRRTHSWRPIATSSSPRGPSSRRWPKPSSGRSI